MKNSEWGAVAYLSHSIYGINREIYINNSSGMYTGRSGGNVSGSVKTIAEQYSGQSSTSQVSSSGYYTWTGEALSVSGNLTGTITDRTLGTYASTTGNVTGVYDMSGGAYEYVMGNFDSTVSEAGFSLLPNKKYYDAYSSPFNSTCGLATCGGHALSETKDWYSDINYYVYSDNPWFTRGGKSGNYTTYGIFNSIYKNGEADYYIGFRLVAIKGV